MALKYFKYIIISFTIIIGCEKIPFDFRNKYCGNYDFEYRVIPWTTTNGFFPAIEGTYSGKVYYEKKAEADIILINFEENITFSFTINRQGKIISCGGSGQFQKRKSVTFEYETSSCPAAGHGGGYNYTVTGVKK